MRFIRKLGGKMTKRQEPKTRVDDFWKGVIDLLVRRPKPEPETDWQAIEDNRLYEKGERPS